ncbi:hypothetical protein CBL_05055 [Carabus blaptoides fortunei]
MVRRCWLFQAVCEELLSRSTMTKMLTSAVKKLHPPHRGSIGLEICQKVLRLPLVTSAIFVVIEVKIAAANGQAERYVKSANNTLKSIGMTPSKLLLGYSCDYLCDQRIRDLIRTIDVNEPMEFCKLRAQASERIKSFQKYNKCYADVKRVEPFKYQVKDLVCIRRPCVVSRVESAFAPKFLGPYVVTKVLDSDRKGTCSILLQGVVDHRCIFIDVFCGEPGSTHDARPVVLKAPPQYLCPGLEIQTTALLTAHTNGYRFVTYSVPSYTRTAAEKLQYLKLALKNEPVQLIQSFANADVNY